MNPVRRVGQRMASSPSARRYRTDPEYREKALKRAKVVYHRNKKNPVWMALSNTRKRICEVREALDRYTERCEEKAKQLFQLLKRRDELIRELANHKGASQI